MMGNWAASLYEQRNKNVTSLEQLNYMPSTYLLTGSDVEKRIELQCTIYQHRNWGMSAQPYKYYQVNLAIEKIKTCSTRSIVGYLQKARFKY